MFSKCIAFVLVIIIVINIFKGNNVMEGLSDSEALEEAKLNRSRVATITEEIEQFEFLNPMKRLTELEGAEIKQKEEKKQDEENEDDKIVTNETNLALADSYKEKIHEQDIDFIEHSNSVMNSIE